MPREIIDENEQEQRTRAYLPHTLLHRLLLAVQASARLISGFVCSCLGVAVERLLQ